MLRNFTMYRERPIARYHSIFVPILCGQTPCDFVPNSIQPLTSGKRTKLSSRDHLVLVLSTGKEAFPSTLFPDSPFIDDSHRPFWTHMIDSCFCLFLPTFLRGKRVLYVTDATYRNSCTTLVLDSLLFCTAKTCMYTLCSWGNFRWPLYPALKLGEQCDAISCFRSQIRLFSCRLIDVLLLRSTEPILLRFTSRITIDPTRSLLSRGIVEKGGENFKLARGRGTSVECNLDFCSREKRWI